MIETWRRGVAALVVAALALAFAGCGGDESNADRFDGEEQEVAEVIDQLGKAARESDAKTICEDLVTKDLQKSIRTAAGTSCAQEVTDNIADEKTEYEVESVDVKGDQATAKVTDQEDRKSTLAFQRVEGDWRIASIT